ncbi:MAG: hypothetical protein AYK19_08630 [Theionarchaea archaeon DG-70-1]|nr:MAG: hypothetical protein AYK19_08630 [Theionarchaea archaeon DG-70-1]
MDEGRMDEGRMDEGSEGRMDEGRMDEGRMDEGRMDEGRMDEGRMDERKMEKKERMDKSPYYCRCSHKRIARFYSNDSKEFKNLIEQAEYTLNGRKIALALADGAHDNKDSFNHLKEKGITSGIKLRKNASTRSRGSPYRAQCARELKKIGYKAWKEKYCYGMRWASEGFFSAAKQMFGENIRATSAEGMIQEVKMKFLFYNKIVHTV